MKGVSAPFREVGALIPDRGGGAGRDPFGGAVYGVLGCDNASGTGGESPITCALLGLGFAKTGGGGGRGLFFGGGGGGVDLGGGGGVDLGGGGGAVPGGPSGLGYFLLGLLFEGVEGTWLLTPFPKEAADGARSSPSAKRELLEEEAWPEACECTGLDVDSDNASESCNDLRPDGFEACNLEASPSCAPELSSSLFPAHGTSGRRTPDPDATRRECCALPSGEGSAAILRMGLTGLSGASRSHLESVMPSSPSMGSLEDGVGGRCGLESSSFLRCISGPLPPASSASNCTL